MAYLHCHNCNWSQDDFWNESYNPITFLEQNFKKDLLHGDLNQISTYDRYYREQHLGKGVQTKEEMICHFFESAIQKIKHMKYRTHDDYLKNNPERKCPNCGKKELDID